MGFLMDDGATINMQAKTISFSSDHATTPKPSLEQPAAVSITDDHLTLRLRPSLMVTVYSEDAGPDIDVTVESDQSLVVDRGIFVARGIVCLEQGESHVLVPGFTEEYQHLNKDSTIVFLEEKHEPSDVIAVTHFECTPEDVVKLPHPFDVNLALPQEKRKKLLDLLHHYIECFLSKLKILSDTSSETLNYNRRWSPT